MQEKIRKQGRLFPKHCIKYTRVLLQKSLNKARDSRLPAPGSTILKTYHGKIIEVKVLENGFEYDGKIFKSISRVAMSIVKRQISGYVFFGLNK